MATALPILSVTRQYVGVVKRLRPFGERRLCPGCRRGEPLKLLRPSFLPRLRWRCHDSRRSASKVSFRELTSPGSRFLFLCDLRSEDRLPKPLPHRCRISAKTCSRPRKGTGRWKTRPFSDSWRRFRGVKPLKSLRPYGTAHMPAKGPKRPPSPKSTGTLAGTAASPDI